MMSGILDRLLLALLLCGPLPAVALELEGPLLQGGVVIGQVAPGTPVSLDGHALRVSEDGLFVIGFDRDSPQSHTLVAGAETRELAIKQREYAIQRVTGIAQNIMSPSAADLERIAREQRLVNAARGRDDPRSDFAAGFSWPILGPTSGF